MKPILLVVLMILISTCKAGTIRHDVEESKYLDFGKKFFCVKQLITVKDRAGNKEYGVASCVILNEHWCITSAHVADSDLDFVKVVIDDKDYCIDKIIIHNNFDSKKHTGDIALGFCEKGFGKNIHPTKIYKEKINTGEFCSIAGYGKYGNMKSGARIFDGKIRAGSNKIEYRYNDMIICDGSEKNPTSLEFLPNIGDSGGGLFIKGELAGITSLVLGNKGKTDSQYGDEAGFVELYQYREWIKKYVKKTQM